MQPRCADPAFPLLQLRLAAGLTLLAVVGAGCGGTTPSPTGGGSPAIGAQSGSPNDSGFPTPSLNPGAPSDIGQVVADEPLVLRSRPGTGSDSEILEGRLYPGMRFRITDGPAMASGYTWYRVRVGALEGWAAAGTRAGDPFEPWLARVENGVIAVSSGGSVGGDPIPQVFLLDGTDAAQLTTLIDADLVTRVADPSGNVLALTCGTEVYGLAWSPDGSTLAFSVGDCASAVYAIGADGSDQRRLGTGGGPAWSADGRRIAFGPNVPFLLDACGADAWDLQVVDLDGGGGAAQALTRLQPCLAGTSPAWSPDGRSLAYVVHLVADIEGDDQAVRAVDLDSGRELVTTPGLEPRWSPDGTRLLVERTLDGNGPAPGCGDCEGGVWSIETDDGAETLLALGRGAEWSPASDRIAYWRGYDPSLTTVADGDGTNPRVLELPGRFVGWSPDGRQLLLIDQQVLWSHPVGGGAPVQMSEIPVGDAAWQPVLVPLVSGG